MRGGKGIRNSKFEMRKLEENAHAKPANILLTPRTPRTESPDAGRGADAGVKGLRYEGAFWSETSWICSTSNLTH